MLRKRSRSAPLICTINFNGFAVVMSVFVFVLFVTMMISTAFHGCVGLSEDLPKAYQSVAMPRANRDDAMVIAITRDGSVYIKSGRVPPDQLPAMIRESVTGGAERKVYLKVDRHARYRVVMGVLAEVRSAGVEKIAFLVNWHPPPQS